MKKIIATFVLLLAVITMASCNNKIASFKNIEISGYKTEFVVGDKFEKGDLVVTAVFTDGKSKDVTADATVEAPEVLDKVGSQVVKVSYNGDEQLYVINVAAEAVATYENVNAAIEAAVANANKVVSGTVVTKQYSENVTNYTFGENFTVIEKVSDELTYQYEDLGDDLYFGFYYTEYEGVKDFYTAYEATANHLAGPEVYEIVDGSYFYGAEGLLTGLYALAKDAGQDLEEVVDACEVCGDQSFAYSFGYLNADYDCYYLVEVEFDLNKNGVLTNLEVESKKYNSTYEAWGETYNNYTVNEETGLVELDMYAEYASEVTAKYTQVEGERNAENEYAYDKVMYTSFDLQDAEGNAAPTVYNIMAGESVSFVIANALPETAVAGLNNFEFNCDMFGYFGSVYDNQATVTVYAPGTYNMTLTAGSVVKEFTIVAAEPQPESVSAYASELVEGWWGTGYEMMETNEVTIELGDVLYVSALVNPTNANQEITIALKEEYAAASLTEVSYDDWNAPYFDNQVLNFNATELGTYVVVFTSVADETLTAELTITVVEAGEEPGGDDTPSIIGTWNAVHPMTGMNVASFEIMDGGYAQFSAGMTMGMVGYTLDGTTLEFQVPPMLAGTIAISDVVLNAELTEFTATITLNGEPLSLTFTKAE